MVSWLPNKRNFISFNILETLKDSPLTLKLLEQRVRESVVGPLFPPPPPPPPLQTTLWGAKGSDQEGLPFACDEISLHIFWMYFIAVLRILRTSQANTRLSGSQSTAAQARTLFLYVVIFFLQKLGLWNDICHGDFESSNNGSLN